MTSRRKSPKNSASSQKWLNRQSRDIYVKSARESGHVSRAYYKLEEIDKRLRLLTANSQVLELGAAPGGWTSYIESKIDTNKRGKLIVCDTKPIQAAAGTFVIKGLYGEPSTEAEIEANLVSGNLDLVLSDMAPNITGVRITDQAASIELAELAKEAAKKWLRVGGNLVVKVFQGDGSNSFVKELKRDYSMIQVIKPRSSRAQSREVYVVGQRFLGDY